MYLPCKCTSCISLHMHKPMYYSLIAPRCKIRYNYMMSSTLLKLFDYSLSPSLTERGIVSPLQFANRSIPLTTQTTALLKEAIGKHITQGSYGYTCFMGDR